MKSAQMNREELLKENRRLIKNLRARFGRQVGVELSAPIYARSKFNETLQNTPKDLRQLDDSDLRDLYRDLTYISGLKTATKQGAERAEREFEPIRQFLEPFSKETRDKWWEMFGKIYEEMGQSIAEQFKYEILDVNKSIFQRDLTTEDFGERFANMYEQYKLNLYGGNETNEGLKIAFKQYFGINLTFAEEMYLQKERYESLIRKSKLNLELTKAELDFIEDYEDALFTTLY